MAQNKQATNPGMLIQAAHSVQLVWRLMRDPRVPLLYKFIVPLALVYVVSPIDLIPDMIPIAGQIDDIGVLLLAMRFFIGVCPPDVVMEHRRALGEATTTTASVSSEDVVDGTYRVIDDDKR